MGCPDLNKVYADVEQGLESQQGRLADALEAQAFWDFMGKGLMNAFLRDAENPFDYIKRPYRGSGLTRQIIEILTEHLYSPGPTRTWDVPAGNTFLLDVYNDNHIDAMMLRADQLSSLSDIAAIQVDADEGVFRDKPITLRLWGSADFHVWCDPLNRTIAKVVCTIDRYDDGILYRVWTEKDVSEYHQPKQERASGDKVAIFQNRTPHKYGCLPFAFVHYVQPITTFWEVGIGSFLVQSEVRTNDRLSRLDESIAKHLNPLPVATNVDDKWQPIIQPQLFIRLNNSRIRPSPTGGYEAGDAPKLEYLEAHVDIAGAWDDLKKYLDQVLQAMKVPASAVRMEQTGFTSGVALIVEQAPLLTRARARRKPWSIYEQDLACTILRCAGGHYGRGDLVAAAKKGMLSLGWPQPNIAVPTKDNLDLLLEQISSGLKSLPMALQEWYGVDREQSFQILEQIEEDNEELAERVPSLVHQSTPPPTTNPDGTPIAPENAPPEEPDVSSTADTATAA